LAQDQTSRTYLDQIALSLGKMVISCSNLEHDLTMAIAQILSLNEVQERTLVMPMGISGKLTLLNRIAKDYLTKDEYKRVTNITDQIRKAADKRNDLIHGVYVHAEKDKSAAVLSFAGAARIKGAAVKLEPRELELFIVNLNWLQRELTHSLPLFPKIENAPPGIGRRLSD